MGAIETKTSEGKLSLNFPAIPADQKPLYDTKYGDIILTETPENGPLAIKEKIIDSPNALSKLVEVLADEGRSKHPNMVSIHSYKLIKEGNICSSVQKLFVCVEYLKRDLASEIRAKRLQQSYFHEQEVLKLAKSIVGSLAYLQKQSLYFGNLKSTTIMIDNNNNYKIGDPLFFGSSPTYFHCLNQSILHVGEDYTRNYLPPKLMYALSQKISEPQHNPYKSDVFVLGVLLIEVMALRNCYEAFDFVNFCVRWEKLDEILASAGGSSIHYSDSFISFVKKLISFEESKRPDFLELSEFFKGAQLRSSSNILIGDQTRATVVKSTRSVNDLGSQMALGGPQAHPAVNNQQSNPHHQSAAQHTQSAAQHPQSAAQHTQSAAHHTQSTSHHSQTALHPAYNQQMQSANYGPVQYQNHNQSENNRFFVRKEEEKMIKSPVPHQERAGQSKFLGDITNYNVQEQYQNFDRNDNRAAGINLGSMNPSQGNKLVGAAPAGAISMLSNNNNKMGQSNGIVPLSKDFSSPHPNHQQYQYSPGLSVSQGLKSDYTQSPLYTMPANLLGACENKEQGLQDGKQQNQLRPNGPQWERTALEEQRISYAEEKHTNVNILGNDYASFSQPKGLYDTAGTFNSSSNNYFMGGSKEINIGATQKAGVGLAGTSNNDQQKTFKPLENHDDQDWLAKAEGPKEFARETYEDGSVYEGDKCGGFRHGRGKFYYCDGGLYEGDWEQGRMNGYGVLYYPNGKRAYEGEWSNDKFNGRGVVYNESPSAFVNEVNYYDLDTVEDFWIRYEGEFCDDNKEGLGTVFFANGEKYTGTFKNDLAHGKGTFFKNDSSIVTGEWIENKLVRVY